MDKTSVTYIGPVPKIRGGEGENKITNTQLLRDLLNNKLTRVVLALLFFLFLYKIIYSVLIFFSLNENIIQMYMAWIAILILLLSILPTKRYAFVLKN
jgi:hypothetical protein